MPSTRQSLQRLSDERRVARRDVPVLHAASGQTVELQRLAINERRSRRPDAAPLVDPNTAPRSLHVSFAALTRSALIRAPRSGVLTVSHAYNFVAARRTALQGGHLVTNGNPPGSAPAPAGAKGAASGSQWLQIFKPRPAAAARLFCFPFAGGGAQSFSQWAHQLPETVELCAVQLPGRETRMREPPVADAHALVRAMAPALVPRMREPFVLFGHSMGAILAYELARLLETQWQLSPRLLIVSGRVAPHRRPPRSPINKLPQAEFVAGLKHLNGTPAEILEDRELMAMIVPMLRADFAVHEEYIYREDAPLQCDVLALGGLRDPEAGRTAIADWREMTAGAFSLRMFPGDHFFIQSAQALLLRTLSLELRHAIEPVAVFQGD